MPLPATADQKAAQFAEEIGVECKQYKILRACLFERFFCLPRLFPTGIIEAGTNSNRI